MQNVVKHLHEQKGEEENEEKKKEKKREKNEEKKIQENEETRILSDFSACMFEYKDIADFEQKSDLRRKNVSKQTIECSCWMFDRIGILCGHALKVLDLMNIKSQRHIMC